MKYKLTLCFSQSIVREIEANSFLDAKEKGSEMIDDFVIENSVDQDVCVELIEE